MVQMIISAPGEQPLPAVAWNYEEVKAEVEASLAQYKDRAYTPETIGGAKADRAALNKLADVLAAKRREVKAQYLAPYENFERQCKEVEGMIAAARAGTLCLDKLEAMTCVCSVGLDMIAVPGNTSAETLSAIIADEAAIGMVNSKTTAVRLIPAPGRQVGDLVEFGGLLGSAPVQPVHPFSAKAFVDRGGRIPAPMQSLKN